MKKGAFLYDKIYMFYKELIVTGKLPEGTKLPSIRNCAELHQVSKTTVAQAYINLCDDGYLLPISQSGYYVSYRSKTKEESTEVINDSKTAFSSDYTSTGVDATVFDLSLWTKYVKNALRQDYRLRDYGLPQGEKDLRQQIAKYAADTRNCVCDETNIVIGAGVQTLLNILCALIQSDNKTVYFNDENYKQGTAVFKDRGYKTENEISNADILYISPSRASKRGDIMPIAQRHSIVKFARKNSKLIIEDDYDSEFRDLNRPTPSLQGLDSENVVYVGTFSKMLLPSIRISYMILPSKLIKRYNELGSLYNQTVSIPDQIALKNYIHDGRLSAQIKKARKLYTQKSKVLIDSLLKEFDKKIIIEKTANPLYVRCRISSAVSLKELTDKLENNSRPIRIIPVGEEEGAVTLAFSVSAVTTENIPSDMNRLAKILL